MLHYSSPSTIPPADTPPDSPSPLPASTIKRRASTGSEDPKPKRLKSFLDTIAVENQWRENPQSSTSTKCHICSTKSLSQVAVELSQRLIEALESANPKQRSTPPPPTAKPSGTEELKARASIPEFKKVNEVWDKKECKYKVVESSTPPDEENKLDQYAFVARTRIIKKTEDRTYYVDIKSASLRDILQTVLQCVKGICLREEKPSVEQNLLYHYLLDLEEYRKKHSVNLNSLAQKHLDLLLEFIRATYAATTEQIGSLLEKHEITYDLLWTLFKPNTLIYTKCFGTGRPRCIRCDFGEERTAKGGIKYFHIEGRYLDFDGKVFGEASIDLAIEKFRGTKKINALESFPLHYHQNEKDARAHLIECGQRFLSMIGIHHCQYRGTAFRIEKGQVVEIFVSSRIVVDAAYFREEHPNYTRPSIKEPDQSSSSGGWLILDDIPEKPSSSVRNNGTEPSEVKGDDFLICSPTVPGFSLEKKLWAEFAVVDIRGIEWLHEPLDHLQIPDKKKKVIQALSEAQMKRKRQSTHSFDDFVAGKGQGFNVLLHGPPGVGKTLTVELLAEHLQQPIYAASAGELGTNAEVLEARLPLIFQRSSRWNAILLLDEADVFLEQRCVRDLHRNALVSVFLRILEYYPGMMILTTNRLRQIDDAITSRIHFKLKYGDLGRKQRSNIWRRFLEKVATQGPPIYSCKEFEDLVDKQLNGREIKNLVSTAHALATEEDCPVTISHLKLALTASQEFECDFNGAGTAEINGIF